MLLTALAVVVVTGVPYLLAWPAAGARQFSGFLFAVEDGNSYMSKMQQGAHGDWLFHIAYTTEPHRGTLLFVLYLLLGHVAQALAVPLAVMHQAARWAAGLLMLLVTYRFIALFVRQPWIRQLAWLLVALGGGSGWLLGWGDWLGSQPIDLYVPEGFAVLTLLYNLWHLALAQACLLGGLCWLVPAVEGHAGRRAAVYAGLAWLLMALAVPFDIVVAGAITAAYLAAETLRRRALPWREIGLALLAGAPVLPYAVYGTWAVQTDPVLATWSAQNLILSPHPLHYLLGYLPLIVLALWAVPWALEEGPGRSRRLWLLSWIAVVPLLAYLPINVQRRLIEGVQVPLAILAAMGVARLGATLARRRPRLRRGLRVGLVAVLVPTTLFLLIGATLIALTDTGPVYHAPELVAVAGWLEQHAPGAHVLSSYATGNALPALAYVSVYVGHDPETPDVAHKQAAVAAFYRAATPDAERQALLAAGRIDYVVVGPNERRLAGAASFDPARAAYLAPVFAAGEWALYRVERPHGAAMISGRPHRACPERSEGAAPMMGQTIVGAPLRGRPGLCGRLVDDAEIVTPAYPARTDLRRVQNRLQ